jgi:gamma-glutamylcyclotransferase (GGCT)/AIG2-like uncharacterized protein YtfP
MSAGIRVFVYGTLKQGHGNHTLLNGAKFLGRSMIRGNYQLVDLGAFPGLIQTQPEQPAQTISGEVYLVSENTLRSLDMLEGNGHFYTRVKIPTAYKNAWTYFLPERYLNNPIVEGGAWRPNESESEFVANERKVATT